MTIEIPTILEKDISAYIELNSIDKSIQEFALDMLNRGFFIEKYGVAPFSFTSSKKEKVEVQSSNETETENPKNNTKKIRIIKS